MPFRSLGLGEQILRAIQEAGYTEPTPIQAAAIPSVLSGQDVIGIAQTGTGKTAAYTLPLLARLTNSGSGAPGDRIPGQPRWLVLAPTRELVIQINENVRGYAKHLDVNLALVYGGVGEQPQIQALRHADIVVATPGRLLDLMGQRHANFRSLKHLVLDEADRMLDMGFLPDIRRIVRSLPQDRQTLLFSASLSREIEAVALDFLQHPKTVQIGRRANPADTVTQFVYEVQRDQKTELLARLLKEPSFDMVLVFSRTKHGADRLQRQLDQRGFKAATLHSNRSQAQRLRALKDFKSGAVRVLVATDIASRGIDVDGISHVINYDFPLHSEDYVHRIGRTGRAQAVGDAISFVTPEDHSSLRSLERFIGRGLIRKRIETGGGSQADFGPSETQARRKDFAHARETPPHLSTAARHPVPQPPAHQTSQSQEPRQHGHQSKPRFPSQFRPEFEEPRPAARALPPAEVGGRPAWQPRRKLGGGPGGAQGAGQGGRPRQGYGAGKPKQLRADGTSFGGGNPGPRRFGGGGGRPGGSSRPGGFGRKGGGGGGGGGGKR